MSEKKQTAVGFLISELVKKYPKSDLLQKHLELNNELIEKAKEMEREQIIDAVIWFDDTDRRPCEIEKQVKQFYKETYGE